MTRSRLRKLRRIAAKQAGSRVKQVLWGAAPVASALLGFVPAARAADDTPDAGGGLAEVVVTAQKRTENMQDVPVSIQAFGTEKLEQIAITQPVFQRKKLKTAYEVAEVDREKTVIQFKQSVLTAVGEVSDALGKISKLREQRIVVTNRVDTLQLAIVNANSLFRNGLANYLEVITAQSNVLQSQLELASIKKGQLSAEVELYRSLGGGWN